MVQIPGMVLLKFSLLLAPMMLFCFGWASPIDRLKGLVILALTDLALEANIPFPLAEPLFRIRFFQNQMLRRVSLTLSTLLILGGWVKATEIRSIVDWSPG